MLYLCIFQAQHTNNIAGIFKNCYFVSNLIVKIILIFNNRLYLCHKYLNLLFFFIIILFNTIVWIKCILSNGIGLITYIYILFKLLEFFLYYIIINRFLLMKFLNYTVCHSLVYTK